MLTKVKGYVMEAGLFSGPYILWLLVNVWVPLSGYAKLCVTGSGGVIKLLACGVKGLWFKPGSGHHFDFRDWVSQAFM